MTKNTLLAAAAVGVMAFAGAAQAHDVTFRAVAAGGAISSEDTNAAANPDTVQTDASKYPGLLGLTATSLNGRFLLAREAISVVSNTLQLNDVLSSGSIPSGNNLYTITLANATFSAAVTSAAVAQQAGSNCTISLNSGGALGSNSVTFIVSASGGLVCSGFDLDLPITPSMAGNVNVNTNLRTEVGTGIDGQFADLTAVVLVDAFAPIYDAAFTTSGATSNTGTTITSSPIYTTLVTGPSPIGANDAGNLGSVAIYVDTRANDDFVAASPVATTDVTDADLTVTGSFTAFNAAAANALFSGASTDTTGATTTAAFNNRQAVIAVPLSTRGTGGTPKFSVVADGDIIPSSAYTGSLAYTLTALDFGSQTAATGNFETLERFDGTSFYSPWLQMNSTSTAVVRISNVSTAATGTVNLTMRANNGGTVFSTCQLTAPMLQAGTLNAGGGIPANAAIEVTGKSLADNCFGTTSTNADVLWSLEAFEQDVTAKVRVIGASGAVFETSLGRLSDVADVAY